MAQYFVYTTLMAKALRTSTAEYFVYNLLMAFIMAMAHWALGPRKGNVFFPLEIHVLWFLINLIFLSDSCVRGFRSMGLDICLSICLWHYTIFDNMWLWLMIPTKYQYCNDNQYCNIFFIENAPSHLRYPKELSDWILCPLFSVFAQWKTTNVWEPTNII